jgi:hypothetical protein
MRRALDGCGCRCWDPSPRACPAWRRGRSPSVAAQRQPCLAFTAPTIAPPAATPRTPSVAPLRCRAPWENNPGAARQSTRPLLPFRRLKRAGSCLSTSTTPLHQANLPGLPSPRHLSASPRRRLCIRPSTAQHDGQQPRLCPSLCPCFRDRRRRPPCSSPAGPRNLASHHAGQGFAGQLTQHRLSQRSRGAFQGHGHCSEHRRARRAATVSRHRGPSAHRSSHGQRNGQSSLGAGAVHPSHADRTVARPRRAPYPHAARSQPLTLFALPPPILQRVQRCTRSTYDARALSSNCRQPKRPPCPVSVCGARPSFVTASLSQAHAEPAQPAHALRRLIHTLRSTKRVRHIRGCGA